MTEDEPITTAERYTTAATASSHLRAEVGHCDLDLLIAAGKLSSPLGALLWRLRGEFDVAKAEQLRFADDPVRVAGQPTKLGEPGMLLMRLRSLYSTKQRLLVLVLEIVQGDLFVGMTHEEAALVAMRVVDAWLDPICGGCDGRGFNGGTHRGEQKVTCRACRGARLRRASIARNGQQRLFADRIYTVMSEAMFTTEVEMRAMLRGSVAVSA